MHLHAIVVAFMILALATATSTSGKDVRDGSSFDRAILVPKNHKQYVDWEWDYLEKRFMGRGMPKQHALIEHNKRMYDRFVFSTRDGDKIIYFDVTPFHRNLVGKLEPK